MLVVNGKPLSFNGKFFEYKTEEPTPPGPSLPPYTIRLKYKQGTTPTFDEGTGVLIDSTNNIWDLTYENTNWYVLLQIHTDLLEVIDANTTGVTDMSNMFTGCTSLTTVTLFDTSSVEDMSSMFDSCTSLTTVSLFNTSKVTRMSSMFNGCTSLTTVSLFNTSKVTRMYSMFANCSSLTTVPLFDTSKVTNMWNMFIGCTSLTTVPLFDTSSVEDMGFMFSDCFNVQSGALALYQQASTQANPPTYHDSTFRNCGRDTDTGAAELAQISSDWK